MSFARFTFQAKNPRNIAALFIVSIMSVFMALPTHAQTETISPFIGSYTGTAELMENDTKTRRDMSVQIAASEKGFSVGWTSGTYKPDGSFKEKSYNIEFVTSGREGIFASAMQTNVFGKQVPLNPLEGEPFVWAKIVADTLTVFSLFIDEEGEYEMQEYHRTLAEGGLDLEFKRFRNGVQVRTIGTFLERE